MSPHASYSPAPFRSDRLLFKSLLLTQRNPTRNWDAASPRLTKYIMAVAMTTLCPVEIAISLARSCPNLRSLDIGIGVPLPRSILQMPLPFLTSLRCNVNGYTSQEFTSPFFRNVRYFQPIYMDARAWRVWTTGGLANMQNLAYLALHGSSIAVGSLREDTAALFASLPTSLELLLLSLPNNMEADPAFEDLRTGELHSLVVPCFTLKPNLSNEWVIVEDLLLALAYPKHPSVDPEPFWDRGKQIVQARMAQRSNSSG